MKHEERSKALLHVSCLHVSPRILRRMIHATVIVLLVGACACCVALAAHQDEPHPLLHAGAKLQKLAGDMKFTEGPVWIAQGGGYLIFSDIPADELKRWSMKDGLGTFRKPSHQTNGNTLDREGRLISCEHAARRVTRTEGDGAVTVLVDSFERKQVNSPHDAAVQSDGPVGFTAPH